MLGNPFAMKSEADRDQVIAQYRAWLWHKVRGRGPVFTELVRIRKLAETGEVRLLCWCAPKACHGDVIKRCVEWMIRENVG